MLTCTPGAQGKCVCFSYQPWPTGPHGEGLLPYWQACLHMVRADCCGDGTPHTKDGTLIDIFDKTDIQKDEPGDGLVFEAGWSPQGAVCVNHVRISAIYSLDSLRADCPRLKAEDLGAECTEERLLRDPAALVMNRSRIK